MKSLAIVLTASLCFASCVRLESRETLSIRLSEHEARSSSFWADWQKKEIRPQVGPAPDALVDYIRIDNILNGYAQIPKAAKRFHSFADEVSRAIDEFPPEVKGHLNELAVGIFLVNDLGTSAYAEVLKEVARRPLGFIVLDSEALNRKANEWASWRENTPFEPRAGIETRVRIEPADRDLRKNAISYILLHELGHLVGVAKGAHADWWAGGNPADHRFASISWALRDGSVASRWDGAFRDRDKIRFYADAESRLPGERIPGIYADLVKTDFVSLYAATGIYDDFAETYAMYVHVVLQKRPWELTLLRDGHPLLTMTGPIEQERCKGKREFLAELFADR